MLGKWNVTYEIVTQESAEHGEADEMGFILKDASFRDAFESVQETRTCHVDGVEAIEASDSNIGTAGWLSIYNLCEYLTGAHETRSLHFPQNITPASRRRVARMLNCHGA